VPVTTKDAQNVLKTSIQNIESFAYSIDEISKISQSSASFNQNYEKSNMLNVLQLRPTESVCTL